MLNERNLLEENIKKFKDRFPKEKWNCDKSIIYKKAVEYAYNDAKRAFEGVDSKKKNNEDISTPLAEKIQSYFEEKINFNHQAFCDCFIECFEDGYMKYGGAQKVVNLAFKYLYCFEDFRKEHFDKFKPCHMALDSYILGWCKRTIFIEKDEKNVWSKIEKYRKYNNIQKKIKKYLKHKNLNLNVLEYEFIIWPKAILYESSVSFLSSLDDEPRKDIYEMYPFEKLYELLKEISNKTAKYKIDENNLF